jgi:hypothetical protein
MSARKIDNKYKERGNKMKKRLKLISTAIGLAAIKAFDLRPEKSAMGHAMLARNFLPTRME